MLHARRATLALLAALALLLGFVTPAQATEDFFASDQATRPANPDDATSEELEAAAGGGFGTVTGRLFYQNRGSSVETPVSTHFGGSVRFWRLDEEAGFWLLERSQNVNTSSFFTASELPAGNYRLEFRTRDNASLTAREYWNDQELFVEGDVLTLADGDLVELGNVVVTHSTIESGRLAGNDRFETSVEISRALSQVQGGIDVVYIVNGYGYADALSAGPAASAQGGGLLLTMPNSIPSVVAAELRRLEPNRIVVVGGTSAISANVERQLRGLVADGGSVERIAGANRYETSRRIVADAFPDGVDVLFAATGNNFPDALAAGPIASIFGGAVLLLDGSASRVDAPTRSLIDQLGQPEVAIVGGPNSVSYGVESSLLTSGVASSVGRVQGANRYETAMEINRLYIFTEGMDVAFLATGEGFADALAGGPLAAAMQSPIYLAQQNCMPWAAKYDIEYYFTKELYALGGTSALSNRALARGDC